MNEFPLKLHQKTPGWVRDGAVFHIRIRADAQQIEPLTTPKLANDLLMAAQRYHESDRWRCDLILLMPDHLHAILPFPSEVGMAATIREWKRGAARIQKVKWQNNFFDHRIRSSRIINETWHYIRRNPVAKGLWASEGTWPHWWSGALGMEGQVERIAPNALD